jgi:competence protein ComEC
MNINNYPALKILLLSAIGFVIGKFIPISSFTLISVGFVILIGLIIHLTKVNKSIFPILLLILLGLATSYRTSNLDYNYDGEFFENQNGYFSGKIVDLSKSTKKNYRVIAEGKVIFGNFIYQDNVRIALTIILSSRDKKQYNNFPSGDEQIWCKIKLRPPNKANLPSEFNEVNYFRSLDVQYTAICYSNDFAFCSNKNEQTLQENILSSVNKQIDRIYSNYTRGIVKALLIGDRTEITKQTQQEFSQTGVVHILSVSGFHVGVIAGILYWLFSFFPSRILRFSFTILALSFYIFLIGYPPSAIRAGLMIALYLLANLLQRKANPINIIATVILIIAIVHPATLYSAGFQMSIGAIIGITLLFGPFNAFFQKILKFEKYSITHKIAASLAITFASSAVVSPIVAYYFSTYSVISPLANLVIIPLMLFAQIFSIVSVIGSYFFLSLGDIFANTAQLCIELSGAINHYLASIKYSYLAGGNVMYFSLFFGIIITYMFLSKKIETFVFRFSSSLILSVLFILIINSHSDAKYILVKRYDNLVAIDTMNRRAMIISNSKLAVRKDDFPLKMYLINSKIIKIYYSKNLAIVANKIDNRQLSTKAINNTALNQIYNLLKKSQN